MAKTFDDYYKAVFDADNNIKACGRDACTELIEFVEKTYNVEVGYEDTGFIRDKDLIQALYSDYKKKGV